MTNASLFHFIPELDETTFPAFRERILAHDKTAPILTPRSYPGYPQWKLPKCSLRWFCSLEKSLLNRRCIRELSDQFPSKKVFGRLLQFSHGITDADNRGPVPSAGGLQALELYLISFGENWLPHGGYHYDRPGHHLSQICVGAQREQWEAWVPSLTQVQGGSLLFVIVGDVKRVSERYGERTERFLMLEAGHLMQNLCLLSSSLSLSTVPLGGFFEREIASQLQLPRQDLVMYVGVCGLPQRAFRVEREIRD